MQRHVTGLEYGADVRNRALSGGQSNREFVHDHPVATASASAGLESRSLNAGASSYRCEPILLVIEQP